MYWYQSLITLLLLLDTTGSPQEGANNGEGPIPSTEYPPKVPPLQSEYCNAVHQCPDTDQMRKQRVDFCFGPAPRGHFYHCSIDESQDTVVEFYYRKYPCSEGFYGAPEVDGEEVKMTCKVCPHDRFNPQQRWSPENMDQCRSHYHMARDRHAIQYLPGNSTDPEVSYCDYIDGYASAHEVMLCKEAYQPCGCVYKRDSCHGQELLPDGSCERWCDGQRTPNTNFSCLPRQKPPNGGGSQRPQTTTIHSTTLPTTHMEKTADDFVKPASHDTNSKANYLSPGQIIAIVIGVLVVVVVGVLCYKKRGSFVSITRNIYYIADNLFRIRGNGEVYLQVNDEKDVDGTLKNVQLLD